MRFFCVALLLCSILQPAIAIASDKDIPIVFKLREGLDPENVYVTFYNCQSGISSIIGTYNGPSGTNQVLNTTGSYHMSDFISDTAVASGVPAGVPAILINELKSGRIFISYDSGLKTFGCTQPSTEPSSNDPSLSIRFQPMELDVSLGNSTNQIATPVINTNLTYIDYAAIALSLTVKNATGTIPNNPLLTTVTSETLTDTLGRTSKVDYSAVYPSAAKRLPNADFARVLSPTSVDWYTKYNDWTYYLKTTLYNSTTIQGKPIRIQGLFGGVGGQPYNPAGGAAAPAARNQTQSYDYNVRVDVNGKVTMLAKPGSGDGTVAGIAPANRGDGVGLVDITIDFADLNAGTGIYGNNPPYTVNGTGSKTSGIENDFYGWVVGDLLAGLSWGFPGSPVKFNATYADNLVIGEMSSVEWFGGIWANGTGISIPLSPAGRGYVYDKAQPEHKNYHVYAAGLQGITGAYGFGLQDRNGATLINFNRVDNATAYLEVGVDTEGQSAVLPSPTQESGVTVKVSEYIPKELTQAEINSHYGLNDFTSHTSMCSFNASISPAGSCGTFMIDTNAIPTGPVNGLTFMKFYSNGTPAEYRAYAPNAPQYTDGSWWITDLEGNHKNPTDQLTRGEHYYIHFVIKDNGIYDENATLGHITDPVALGSSGSGSGSGCVMNPRTGIRYELAGLLAAAIILIFLRRILLRNR